MKKVITAFVLAGATLVPLCLNNAVSAKTYNTNSKDCAVKVKGSTNDHGQSSSRFVDNGDGTVTATVVVSGDDDCKKHVSIASWRAPYGSNDYLPIKDQTLFASKTYQLGLGTHDITVAVADCLYQVDLLYGKETTTPKGTAEYPDKQKLGWTFGGDQVCTKHVPVAPTPPPAAPVVEKAPELPASGAGEAIAVFATASVAGTLGFRYFLRRRQSI